MEARLCHPFGYTYIVLLGEEPVSLFFNSKGFPCRVPLRKMLPSKKSPVTFNPKNGVRQKTGERFYYVLIGMTEMSMAAAIKETVNVGYGCKLRILVSPGVF